MSIEFPLTKQNRILLARAFRHVPRVDVSIECVIEGQMGKAFVVSLVEPSVFKIEVGPFLYFAGDPYSAGGQAMLTGLQPYTLLMQSAENWSVAAQQLYGDRLIEIDRYSFSDASISDDHLAKLSASLKHDVKMIDSVSAETIANKVDYFDFVDFDSAEDFIARSIGFYVEDGDQIIAVAHGSLACAAGIEVSIFVADNYRRRGIATALGVHLLQWCRANNTCANWDAANPESCDLAKKLGYTATGSYKAYVLKPA